MKCEGKRWMNWTSTSMYWRSLPFQRGGTEGKPREHGIMTEIEEATSVVCENKGVMGRVSVWSGNSTASWPFSTGAKNHYPVCTGYRPPWAWAFVRMI